MNNKPWSGVQFWVPFIILFLTAIAFFIFTGNSISAWIILFILYAAIVLLRDRIFKGGLLLNILLWVFIFMLTFFLYAFSIDRDKFNNAHSNKVAVSAESLLYLEDNIKLGVAMPFKHVANL